ncbi:MAG TPA: hypothetical protein VFX98_02925, partial [Longimicrobiaceae bacterium]|nr:hypothetical protein [Longimicrobiaceae bacterium]
IDGDYNDAVRALLNAMDPGDHLLYRGLYKFLIASDLRRYPHLLEESAIAAFISREAVLELLRRKLQRTHTGRVRKDDVINQIRREFPTGESFAGVLHTDWEARVIMVHPVSDFGEHWSPPVEAEECFDAVMTLTYLYRYLLLDEAWCPEKWD